MANRPRPEQAAAVAVTAEIRRQAEILASQRDWQESVNRRAEADKLNRS
jgi:hypothetical protein